MKRLICILAAAAVLTVTASCGVEIPTDGSSDAASAASAAESNIPSSEPVSVPAQSSEQPSSPESEPKSEEPQSEPDSASESSAADEQSKPAASSEEPPEESSEPVKLPQIGELFKPYYNTVQSGKYSVCTVESRIVGGEAMPYTVTVYRDGTGSMDVIVEESYGATSEYLVINGSKYILDSVSKSALRTAYSEADSPERDLYGSGLRYTGDSTMQRFETTYDCELYTDDSGAEFAFCFSSAGILKCYRYYDKSKKDTITIDIDISPNISGGTFELPSDYTVTDID